MQKGLEIGLNKHTLPPRLFQLEEKIELHACSEEKIPTKQFIIIIYENLSLRIITLISYHHGLPNSIMSLKPDPMETHCGSAHLMNPYMKNMPGRIIFMVRRITIRMINIHRFFL